MDNGHAGRAGIAVAGAAAVGLLAGLAATAGRKAVAQAAEAMTGDWLDVLKAEHLVMIDLFDELEATSADQKGKRAKLFGRLKAAFDKHALEEENVVYPALRFTDPDGAGQKLYAEHAEVKTLVYELDLLEPDTSDWIGRLTKLRRLVEEHVREEEDVVFPRLRAKMSEDESQHLTPLLHRAGAKLA